jgi:hypothetical protein
MPKKAKEKAKRPVGRPRKNLGTRVSDVPVTTLKPMPRRINVDSVALARARMAYKRDYPDKPLTENQTRAFLDAMQSGKSYGPIGPTILGTKKQTTVGTTTSGFMDYYKDALDEKKSEDAAARGVIASVDTEDGVPSLRINPAAVSAALIRSLRAGITAPPRATGAPSKAPGAPAKARTARAKSGISVSKTPRFTRTRNAPVNVTDIMGQFADALRRFQNAAGRPPTDSEAMAIGENMQAGRPAFDESSIVLPGSAMVNGEPALHQRVETEEEREERSAREAQEEAARRAASRPRRLTKYQQMLQATLEREVDNGTISPNIAELVAEIIPKVSQPPGSRSKRVVMSNAASWVRAAHEAVTGRVPDPPLDLEPPPLMPVPVQEDPEGYQDLGDVFNNSDIATQQAIIAEAQQGNPTAMNLVSASLSRGPDQQAVIEAQTSQELVPYVGTGFDAVGDNRSDWSILMKTMKSNSARGAGYFNSLDNFLNPMPHVNPIDSMQILRDLKAKQARGEPLDGSGLGVPKKRGDYKLASAEFSDKVWNSASSLRWVRSAGLRPLKRAVHAKGKFVYHLADMSKFSKFDQQLATLKNGRKIVLIYGK